jgi:hypothetical protein
VPKGHPHSSLSATPRPAIPAYAEASAGMPSGLLSTLRHAQGARVCFTGRLHRRRLLSGCQVLSGQMHPGREVRVWGLRKQVVVIAHEHPREHPPAPSGGYGSEPLQPLPAVPVVVDDLPPLQSPAGHVVDAIGKVGSQRSGHDLKKPVSPLPAKLKSRKLILLKNPRWAFTHPRILRKEPASEHKMRLSVRSVSCKKRFFQQNRKLRPDPQTFH